jgi:hypothetical protein
MQQIFDQILQFLQQGISAIFRFVRLVWTWSSGEIAKLLQVPWENWPLWKQVLLILLVVIVVWILFGAAVRLWASAVRVLSSFARLLVVLVATLPTILLAGIVALGGLWAINNVNLAQLRLPVLSESDGNNRQANRSAPNESGAPNDARANDKAGK